MGRLGIPKNPIENVINRFLTKFQAYITANK